MSFTPQYGCKLSEFLMVNLPAHWRSIWPHGLQGLTTVRWNPWQDMHVDVRNFLSGKRSVVDTYCKVRGVKVARKALLHLSNPVE